MSKEKPVRLYCSKEFKLLIKKKALEHGFEKYPRFTKEIVKNPGILNEMPKKKNSKGYGKYDKLF